MADGPNLLAGLEEELRSERAFALGRAGKKVEATLAELTAGGADEEELIFAAATAVWHYLIGREAMGIYDHREALEIYGVPARVMAKVGVVRRTS